ncbi:MAG: stage II sporulation protein R [Clostridia bacterium]|nr:stage II sporulation protein R [Clostridia bacterium]
MKNLLTVAVCLAFILIFIGLMPIHGEAEIYDSVVRLHVLANSDTEEDQALKLKVRDKVLEKSAEILSGCASRDEAIALISQNISLLENAAAEAIEAEGCDYPVRIELGEEEYPTKNYEQFCFPSGSYVSLRVLIGNAEGQNWWCVLFPPLCLSAATDKKDTEDAFISVGLTEEQYKIITETDDTKYEVRFKILESIEEAKNSINSFFNYS